MTTEPKDSVKPENDMGPESLVDRDARSALQSGMNGEKGDEKLTNGTPPEPSVALRRQAVALIANPSSGGNAKDEEAIRRAMDALGDGASLYRWSPESDIVATVRKALDDGAEMIVAAGGDGTAMAVAGALVGQEVPMAVLPLGTFNFFARGLRLSEDPEEAARAIREGSAHPIRVGEVNGQVFLNNASLGIYPSILKAREDIYARWGRRRIVAHWSVFKTFLRFQRPMRLKITADGETRNRRTALVFIARSAYQLDFFGLDGATVISDDAFAVLVAKAQSRRDLFRLSSRLVRRKTKQGEDYELIRAKSFEIETARGRGLLAFDGEKCREESPFRFKMSDAPLWIVLPAKDTENETQDANA
ncbi:diacylglycerol kinase family protein [Thioclava sp. DLFJ5-1]|uniref:diacylglycerol/lipid kinase family protein n=1 Tax=Thioclava sp. DLFJ5-1 TaxID=1915314 RepID=UPI001FEDE0DE|nr:diacylglycerol kinase family protein [Thioclava sp. DLFJ5-1]